MKAYTSALRAYWLALVQQGAGYECIIMQGSGTYGVESVLSSVVPRDGKLLIVNNGAYGVRMGAMARVYGIECVGTTGEYCT